MDDALLLQRLQHPKGPVDVVLDTDTFNEIDDQFALAYLLKSSKKLHTKAIFAAPFFNSHSASPEDGMLKSYDEVFHVLDLLGQRSSYEDLVYRGSSRYLSDEKTPVDSPAARKLVELARSQPFDRPLYVVAIAAITNVASALLLDPSIKDKIVIVWLGGHSREWSDNKEFNLSQDVAAARIVFGCGVPVVQLPCMGVVSEFRTTGPELAYWLKGKNAFCDYLVDIVEKEAALCDQGLYWSRAIWDVTAVAWLLDETFERSRLEHSPICEYDDHYGYSHTRHLIRYVYWIDRDRLFGDLFGKLAD